MEGTGMGLGNGQAPESGHSKASTEWGWVGVGVPGFERKQIVPERRIDGDRGKPERRRGKLPNCNRLDANTGPACGECRERRAAC